MSLPEFEPLASDKALVLDEQAFGWKRRRWRLKQVMPGLAAAFGIALIAKLVAQGLGPGVVGIDLLLALAIGLFVGNLFGCPATLNAGLTLTIRQLLRLAIVLVGLRITLGDLAGVGLAPIAVAATVLLVTLGLTWWICRKLLRLDADLSLLLAAGTSVCGASAVLAVSSLRRCDSHSVSAAITLITLFGSLSLIGLPLAYAGGWLGAIDHTDYGVWIGATVFEVAQVVGAGFAVSAQAGTVATIVKLSKVLMLAPLLAALAWLGRDGERRKRRRKGGLPIPWFVLFFVGAVIANSLIDIPLSWRPVLQTIDSFLLLAVMGALGLETRVSRMLSLGARPLVAAAAALLISAGVGYGAVRLLPATPLGVYDTANGPQQSVANSPGGRVFVDIGCAKCHVPSFQVDGQPVFIYSDLLIHDMGPGLDDKVSQGLATGADWRTTPLWGLGSRRQYLHDGRATTLREAILAHGGEALIVRQRFEALDAQQRLALYQFLNSL